MKKLKNKLIKNLTKSVIYLQNLIISLLTLLSKLLRKFSKFLLNSFLNKFSTKRKLSTNNNSHLPNNPNSNYPLAKPARKHNISRFIITTLTAFLFTINFTGIGLFFAQPALAATNLIIEPLTWDFIGLDSNNVNVGPNTFIIGARVCNVGGEAATDLQVKFVIDAGGTGSGISLQFPAFQTISKTTVPGVPQLVSLPNGPDPEVAYPNSGGGQIRRAKYNINFTPSNCFDGYFNVKVARNSSSYNNTLKYHIEASAANSGTVSTPLGRQLYVEKLISQARNNIFSFTNLTTGSNTVYVGGTYDFELKGSTATGYPQLTLTSDFPNIVFQLLRVKTTYETPIGTVNSSVYADACGWIADPSFIGYHESSSACNGINYPKQYGDGSDSDAKVGNNVTTVYTIKVLAMPSTTSPVTPNPVPVSHLILDYSGSSFHYNADYGKGLGVTFITVADAPDLKITKTAPAGPFTVGTNFNYTLNVQNLSTSTATTGTTTVKENLPPGMQFQSFTGAGWSCKNALGNACAVGDQGTLTFSNPSIAANATSTINLTVNPTISGTNIPNTATVSTPNDKDTTNNSSTVNVTVNPAPDLTITKTGATQVNQGQNGVAYTLSVQNISSAPTSGQITVTDTLPTGLTPVTASRPSGNTDWSCSISGQTVTCTNNTVYAANATLPAITITANVPQNATSATVTNTANVSGGSDSNASNNSSSLNVTIGSGPDLAVTSKTASLATFTQGGTVNYTINTQNVGNQATSGTITVTDVLPTGFTYNTFTPGTSGWTCSSGCTVGGSQLVFTRSDTFAAGATLPAITFTANVASNAPASVTNQASIYLAGDINGTNNTNSVTNSVTQSAPALTVSKIALGTDSTGRFVKGSTGYYLITVKNTGGTSTDDGNPLTDDTISFTDTIDSIVNNANNRGNFNSLVSSTPSGWSCAAGTTAGVFTCTNKIGSTVTPITAGSQVDLLVKINIPGSSSNNICNEQIALTYKSVTTTTGQTTGGNSCTASALLSTTAAGGTPIDVTLTKTHTGNFTQGQQNATYTINLKNNSTTALPSTSLSLQDTLPTGLTYVSATGPAGWTCSYTAPTVNCTNATATIAAGATISFTVTVNVDSTASGTLNNVVNLRTPATTPTTTLATATDPTIINVAPDIKISRTGSASVQQGGTGTYTFSVQNLGLLDVNSGTTIFVNDAIPSPFIPVTAIGTGWNCTITGQNVSCSRSDGLKYSATYPDIVVTFSVPNNATPGTINNTAQVSGSSGSLTAISTEVNITNNTSNSVSTTITAAPDLIVSKTDNGSFTQGGTGRTYTVTVTNQGNGAVANGTTITVTDTLPTGITPNFTTGTAFTGWTCTHSGGPAITCTNTSGLAVNGTSSFTFPISISGTAGSPLTNKVQVAVPGEGNTTNNINYLSTVVGPNVTPLIDLTIVKSHIGNFTQGQTGTYTLSVVNIGNTATSGTVTVADTLPSGLTPTFASGTGWNCTITGQAVSCTTTDVLNGGNTAYPDITIGVNVSNTATNTTNTATVSGGGDSNSGNNSDDDPTTIDAPVATPDLAITKTHTGNFDQGGTGSYTITVSNIGSVAVPNGTVVTVTDPLPPDLSAAVPTTSGTGWSCSNSGDSTIGYTVTCTRSDGLEANASYPAITLGVTVSNNPRNQLFNSASVSLPGTENNISNNNINDTTYINQTDLSITKTAPASLIPGQNGAVYTLSVVNVGAKPTDGTTVTVTDILPTGLTPTAASGTGWTCNISGQTVTCTRNSVLAANGAAYPDISLTVNVAISPPAYIVNTASVSGGGDLNTGNNDNFVGVATGTDLAMTKTHTGTFIKGGTGVFNLVVSNVGGSATSGTVTVTDTLVTGFTPTGATSTDPNWTCGISSQTVTCTNSSSLAAGQSYNPINITVSISGTAPNTLTNTASVSGGGDVKPANNSDTHTVYFGSDITIVKTHVGTFTAGQPGIYNLTVSNVGGGASSGLVKVKDTLPSGFTPTAASGPSWTCNISGQTVTCTRNDSLWAGASYPVIAVTVNVPASPNPSVTNTATVSGGGDVNLNNNSSDDVVTFSTAPKLLLVKRITAINGTAITGFEDNTNTSDPTYQDDNDPKWPSPNTDYLRGKINGGFVKPGDVLEYTVYFLSKGGVPAKNVMICDLVPTNTTFLATGFDANTTIPNDGATGSYGIALGWSSSAVPNPNTSSFRLTGAADSDRGEFFPAGSTPSTNCSASNTNGAVVVKVGGATGIPQATGSGTPPDSYGFIRFKATLQ